MKELVFRWGTKDYGSRLFRTIENDKETFIECYLYRYLDESGKKEILRQGEEKYSSFEEFWKEFTDVEFWLPNSPDVIHSDYKKFIREYILTIDQNALTEGEGLFYDLWIDVLDED